MAGIKAMISTVLGISQPDFIIWLYLNTGVWSMIKAW